MFVDIRGLTSDKLEKLVTKAFPKEIKKAQISAMNKVAVTIRARSTRGVSARSKLRPVKRIKERFAIFKANNRRVSCGIYFRTPPMPAEMLVGKAGVKWHRKMKGAKAGRKLYPGTFAGVPHKGKHANKRKRIYLRTDDTGSNKKALEAQVINLEKYGPILPRVGNRVVNQNLVRIFNSQLQYRIDKALKKI